MIRDGIHFMAFCIGLSLLMLTTSHIISNYRETAEPQEFIIEQDCSDNLEIETV